MADHALPTLTQTYTNFLNQMMARADDSVRQNRTDTVTLTNPPTGTVRWNVASGLWEQNTGTAGSPVWAALATTYNILAANAVKWNTGRTIAITGDASGTSGAFDGSGNLSFGVTLATVNSNVGTFGSASAVPVITTNAKGLITSVSTAALGSIATQAASNVSITGGAVSGTALTLVQSTTAAPTVEGRVEWDTDNDTLMIGNGAATKIISPDDIPATLSNKTYATPLKRSTVLGGYLDGNYNTVEVVTSPGAIYTIGGSSYHPTATTLGTMYGVGYTYSTMLGGTVTGLPAAKWGMYGASNGVARWFLESDAGIGYFNGAIYSAGVQCVTANGGAWGIAILGNAATATNLSGTPSDWATTRGVSGNSIANMLGWRNFGNGHVIFDASNGLSPAGGAVNNSNPNTNWSATYPTLMGWNGSSTYGVRVDVCRLADSASAVAWTNVTSRPTALSQFTNDVGYVAGLPCIHVQHQLASGSDPGNTGAAGFFTRALNTVVVNTISGASLASDTVTLPAGTYDVWAAATSSGSSSIHIYNSTDAAYLVRGTSAGNPNSPHLAGRFTLAASKGVTLRVYNSAAAQKGVGISSGQVEVFSTVHFVKVA